MRMKTLAALMVVLVGASCFPVLEQNGSNPPVVTGDPCTVDANCDDDNPCTTELCPASTLVCAYTQQASGAAPTAVQTPEDCRAIICNDGIPSTEDDPQDVINDNNTCTADLCTNGAPTNEILADGSSCSQGTKTGKCALGACEIFCANSNDCDDGNPCSDDLCNTSSSTCVYTNLDGGPTPGVTPIVGDCKVHNCENGVDTESNDDADVNIDGNPCTTDLCAAGTPTNSAVPERTLCVQGDVKVCDSKGTCVECVIADDCVNITETECEKRSCVNNTCQIAYEGNTMLASPVLQKDGDCQKVVCNGNMGTTVLPDDADLPNDGELCTKDMCTNGTPSNPPEAQNFNCGVNQSCNGAGKCFGCSIASQCAGNSDFCKTSTCVNNTCYFSYTAGGTDLPSGQTSGDCKVLECDGMGNVKTSALISDIPVDGNACTQDVCSAQGNPSNPSTAANSPCNVGVNDACDGSGNCKKSLGKTCGAGTECVSTNCVDGVCCNNTCTTLCRSCDVPGSIGTCADVPKGQDDTGCSGATLSCGGANDCDSESGQSCTANGTCLSNFCVDGVCCDSACNTACKSCNVAGSEGTCSNLPAMSQDNAPTNVCTGMNQCDGNGICKKILGATCVSPAQCLSNFCVDGVCCDSACGADCKSCNVMNFLGFCSNVPKGGDDGVCSGPTLSCDGAGACMPE